jgi:hypothetical protein
VGVEGRKKCVTILLDDDSGMLGICVKILRGDFYKFFFEAEQRGNGTVSKFPAVACFI